MEFSKIGGGSGGSGGTGPAGATGAPGAAATIAVGSVTTGVAGSSVAIVNAGTSNAAVLNFAIPKGDAGAKGDPGVTGATGATGPIGLTGESGADGSGVAIDDATPSTTTVWSSQKTSDQLATIMALKWTEKFILNTPADAYVSPSLPLSRNGTMLAMDFYVTGTPASATTITVKQGATTVGSVSLSAAGKTTLTFGAAVTGAADDLFTYTVGGAGVTACVVVCNQKWVNR